MTKLPKDVEKRFDKKFLSFDIEGTTPEKVKSHLAKELHLQKEEFEKRHKCTCDECTGTATNKL